MDRRQVLREIGIGAGTIIARAAPGIQSIAYGGSAGSGPCPFTLTFESGGPPPNRFVCIGRHGEFDCGPGPSATTRLEFVGGAIFTDGILRVPEDTNLRDLPVTIEAMCSTDEPDSGLRSRIFQSFEELFQAG